MPFKNLPGYYKTYSIVPHQQWFFLFPALVFLYVLLYFQYFEKEKKKKANFYPFTILSFRVTHLSFSAFARDSMLAEQVAHEYYRGNIRGGIS